MAASLNLLDSEGVTGERGDSLAGAGDARAGVSSFMGDIFMVGEVGMVRGMEAGIPPQESRGEIMVGDSKCDPSNEGAGAGAGAGMEAVSC